MSATSNHQTVSTQRPTSSGLDLLTPSVSKWKTKAGKQTEKLEPTASVKAAAVVEEKGADAGQLEVQLTQDKLARLQQIFEEADDDDDPGLDMEEFRVAMRRAIGPHLTDTEIDTIFMKVDSNCDGTVDWDEYLSYMLLECRGKDKMADEMTEKPFPKCPRRINIARCVRIHDTINKIDFAPSVAKNTQNMNFYKITDEDSGRYITITREGVVNLFNTKLKHVKQYKVVQEGKPFTGTLVTGTTVLPNLNLLAVATTSCNITCYDLSGSTGAKEFEKRLIISDLEICATCLSYWTDKYDEQHNILLWGDVRGNVSAVVITDAIIFNPVFYGLKMKIPFSDIMKGRLPGAKGYKLSGLHNDFVKQVRYISNLNGFFSACRDGKTGLYLGDLEQRQHGDHFKVQGGVFSFDYSSSNNVVVTGGKDGAVRVWNPYVKKKPVMTMQGHNCPIIEIRINEKLEHIISVSELKEIRIYDLNTQACVQLIQSKYIPLGLKSISAVHFSDRWQALVLANNSMILFQHQAGYNKNADLHSHTKPVTCVLYNSLFGQIVSGSADSQVCVWSMKTGERIIQFTAHVNEKAESMDKEITTMSFDPTLRRLITATRDGFINMWNFNNGACLRSIESDCDEITSILWTGQRIFTAGWSQRIIVYIDAKTDEENDVVTTWAQEHKDDIQAITHYGPSILASGSYDGDIIIWSLETGHVTMQFNAFKGTKPFSTRGGIEIQLGKAASVDSMETLKSDTTPSSSTTSANSANTRKESETLVRKRSLLPGLKMKQRKSPRGYRRFLTPQNQDLRNENDNNNDEDVDLAEVYASQFATRRRRAAVTEKTGHSLIQSNKDSVEALVFLSKRQNEKGVATLLSAGTRGWVRAWSIHHDGGLIGQFNAAHEKGNTILTMLTDPDEKYLVTGDSQGYIKVWHIKNYCDSSVHKASNVTKKGRLRSRSGGGDRMVGASPLGLENIDPELKKKFPFLRIEQSLRIKAGSQAKHDPPPDSTNPSKTHIAPPLLNSFRAHLAAITSMTYAAETECLLTGSVDKSVRCFTLTGHFVGICGQKIKWTESPQDKSLEHKKSDDTRDDVLQYGKKAKPRSQLFSKTIGSLQLPPDVRRVASATTLKVYYGGVRPFKNVAKNLVMFWMPRIKKTLPKRQKPVEKDTESADQKEQSEDELLEMVRNKKESEPEIPSQKEFRLPKVFPDVCEGKGIFREKPKKFQVLVQLPKLTMHQNQLRVYSSMPCQELEPIKPLAPPSTIVEITARKAALAAGKGKGRLKRRTSRQWRGVPVDYYTARRKSTMHENLGPREGDKQRRVRLSPLGEKKPQGVRNMTIVE